MKFLLSLLIFLAPFVSFAQGDQVIAVVNENVITEHDLRQRSIFIARQLGEPSLAQETGLQERAMGELIDELLKIDYAAQIGIELPEGSIENFKNFLRQQNPDVDFDALMAGVTETAEQQVRSQLLWQRVVERTLRPRVVISDAEIDALVEGLVASSAVKEYEVRHIFLENRDDRTPSAKDRLQEIYTEITATDDADFAAYARRYGEDGTATDGGYLGWLNTSEILPALGQAISSLEPGRISEPVRSSGGWHLVKLVNIRSAPPPTGGELQRVRERIREKLTGSRLELTARRLMRDLRRRAFIDVRLDS